MRLKPKAHKIITRVLTSIITIVASFFIVSTVYALDTGLTYLTASGLGTFDIRLIAMSIVNVALGFLGVIAIGIVLYGGFVWMTSGGSPEKVEKAKRILTNGAIGLAIILLSFALTSYILSRLGEATGALRPCNYPTDGDVHCFFDANDCEYRDYCESNDYWSNCRPDPGDPDCSAVIGPACYSDILTGGTIPIRNVVVRAWFNNTPILPDPITAAQFTVTVDGGAADWANCDENRDCLSDYCWDRDGDLDLECDGNVIAGSYNINGNIIEFVPANICPSPPAPTPPPDYNCFSDDATYNINLPNGIISCGGYNLNCSLGICDGQFTIPLGAGVDISAPTVDVLPGQICQIPNNRLQALVTDDFGVNFVRFFADGATIGENTNTLEDPAEDWGSDVAEYTTWDASGYVVGSTVEISATAYDYDLNQASHSRDFLVSAGHCCNFTCNSSPTACTSDADCVGVDTCNFTQPFMDEDEFGPNCGGEDCLACDGGDCDLGDDLAATCLTPEDTLCASYFCEPNDCVCQSPPIIDYISPALPGADLNSFDDDIPYGPPGSWITIFGRNFGTTPGRVVFLSDDLDGYDPFLYNNQCDNYWQDSQITVVVPDGTWGPGAVTGPGPIEVIEGTTGYLLSDRTDIVTTVNERLIIDFNPLIGNARPGICQLNPNSGIFEDQIDVEGIGLSGYIATDTVSFGGNEGTDPTGVSNPTLSGVGVPNLNPGNIWTWVEIAGEESNALNFNALNPDVIPIIYDFEPEQGPPGTYVTITGDNFGYQKGSNGRVDFGPQFSTEANYDFPDECAGEYWSNTQIIVKVPNFAAALPLSRIITVTNNDNYPGNTIGLDPEEFNVEDDFPPPGICWMNPSSGPAGMSTMLYGEYFSQVLPGDGDDVVFYDEQSVISFITTTVGGSSADTIDTAVSIDAITGPVVARDNDLPRDSNPYNFIVGDCTLGTNACDPGADGTPGTGDTGEQECCIAGQFRGACMDTGECVGKPNNSFYLWQFTTGTTGPRVVELCNRQRDCNLGYCEQDRNTTCFVDDDCSGGTTGPCLSSFTSPTPLFSRDGVSATNSLVSARFNQDMRDTTINSTNIYVEQCTDNTPNCATTSGVTGILSTAMPWRWDNQDAEYFNLYPDLDNDTIPDAFTPNTWYRVTLTDDVQSSTGAELIGNQPQGFCELDVNTSCMQDDQCANGTTGPCRNYYTWVFQTDALPGDAGCISCEPSLGYLYFQGDQKEYSGTVYDQNNECVILNNLSYDWNWEVNEPPQLINPPYATITNVDVLPSAGPDGFVDPVQIATAQSESMPYPLQVLAEILDLGLANSCTLYTDFKTPVVTDKWPDCASACINAEIGAAFSRAMMESSIDTDSVYLHICFGDSQCGKECHDGTSYTNRPCQFDSDCPGSDTCENPPEVDITSPQYVTNIAYTCGVKTCANGTVCTSDAECGGAPGSCAVRADISFGEECDDGNLNNGDGCSDKCLNEGSIYTCGNANTASGLYISAVDNPWIDTGEDCDDGNSDAGDGCSQLCLNEGSDPSECDDGNADPGEECEPSDYALGVCTSRCLWAGASNTERFEVYFYPSPGWNGGMLIPGAYYRVVLTEEIQSSEGVALGQLNYDYYSSGQNEAYSWIFKAQDDFALCQLSRVQVNPISLVLPTNTIQLYRGVPFSAPDRCSPARGQRLNPYLYNWDWSSLNPQVADLITPLRDACGNTVIEPGEDCDDGNLNNLDGCSNMCLNEGVYDACGSPENRALNPGFEIIVAD
ncbi:IPT/TIG domain-containing protein [Patescibacteria group bacterium]|nr:IPT/TIG domain-containing protein [Patescibacteria group bacterium]